MELQIALSLKKTTTQKPLGHFKMVMSNRLTSILIYFPL